jgi:hypothetical protein
VNAAGVEVLGVGAERGGELRADATCGHGLLGGAARFLGVSIFTFFLLRGGRQLDDESAAGVVEGAEERFGEQVTGKSQFENFKIGSGIIFVGFLGEISGIGVD